MTSRRPESEARMARELPRWAAKYPELGTGPLPIDPYIEPEFLEFEREHIFRTAWLNVGRIDDVPAPGSYFVREIEICNASVLYRSVGVSNGQASGSARWSRVTQRRRDCLDRQQESRYAAPSQARREGPRGAPVPPAAAPR